LLKFNFKSILS